MRPPKLTVRQRRFARRLAGYAINPVRRTLRVRRGLEQTLDIGGHTLRLPPDHDLPFFVQRDPTYDAYAGGILTGLAQQVTGRTLLIDVGANIGDTAVRALAAADTIDVVAVEGGAAFTGWLHDNLAAFGGRAEVVEAFAGPIAGVGGFAQRGSSGQLVAGAGELAWVTPEELLERGAAHEQIVWKSDTDGYDVHLLVAHWPAIDAACRTLWFEFDPPGTLGPATDIDRLIDLLAASGRRVEVWDNLGRRLVALPAGPAVASGLGSITAWLREQREGHLAVPYVDVWAFAD